jgi:hypothetical protein
MRERDLKELKGNLYPQVDSMYGDNPDEVDEEEDDAWSIQDVIDTLTQRKAEKKKQEAIELLGRD